MQTKTLFSPHYLTHRLPQHPEWAEDPRPVLEALRPLWAKAHQHGDAWNEAQTEEEFIKPVLRILGWSYIVQPKTGKAGRVSRPDYALFADEKARDAAYAYKDQDDRFYPRALAVAEAKYWGRPLSQKDTTGRDTWKADSNPSFQMVSYLVGTRVPWGILTNGILWRLYSREVSSTASEFYEVDLGTILDFLFEDRLFPYVRVSQVSWLPIRLISFTTPADERERLAAEGRTLVAQAIRNTEYATRNTEHASYSAFLNTPLGLWLHARLTADPEQSDVVHDLLAYLAEEMVRMNREKQEEVRGFLAWLEREIGAPLDALTGHTRLRDYLGDYRKGEPHLTLEELLGILRRNRRRLKVDPSARAFQERLEKEYGATLEKLLPLKRRLAATDRLIDLIVYRLYGLTEEEVRVVEESLAQEGR